MDLNKYAKFFENKVEEFDDFCLYFLSVQSIRIINAAKERSPVDTGFLRSSWEVDGVYKENNEFIALIVNGANYSSYVEYGTELQEARNMVTVPINNYNNKVEERFKSAIKRYMEKGTK